MSGTTPSGTQDIVAQIKALGASPQLIAQIEQGTMLQSDYTRKTQELADLRRQIETQAAYFKGQQDAGGGGKRQTPTEKFLSDLKENDPENGALIASLLEQYGVALKQEIGGDVGRVMEPIQQATREQRHTAMVNEYLEKHMVPFYGEGIRDLWKPIGEEIKARLDRGETVQPEAVARDLKGQELKNLLLQTAQEEQKQQQRGHLEGHHTQYRQTPSITEGRPGQQLADPQGKDGPLLEPIDYTAIASEATSEVAAGR